jgi:hypothetical protein
MGVFGNLIGSGLGSVAGRYFGGNDASQNAGGTIGGALGGLLPFRRGGKVPGAKGKPRAILAHGGEWVLPVSVKPTKAQKAKISALRRKC